MADSLQDELLSIPGIASAEFEGSEEHPVGVRVQLAVGADPDQVGQAVQRVLASHGMRSQMAHEEPESFLPPGSVVNLSDYESQGAEDAAPADAADAETSDAADVSPQEADLEVMSGPPPAIDLPTVEVDRAEADAPEADGDAVADAVAPERPEAVVVAAPAEVDDGADDVPPPEPAAEVGEESHVVPSPTAEPASIGGVAVEEDEARVHITVRTNDGRVAARSVPATAHGLDAAAAEACVELAAPETQPRVLAVVDGMIEGAPIVTVMLEGLAGRRFAGTSVVHGSRAYAVARATWAALVT
ncbi:MAG: hypothetical protein QNJ88_14560 [Acidimicrobiia bacterium]|nr:hypothetical protein [Acidimicrobiia bacterium]